jgi:cytochrome b involved in lipid metabolism
MTGLNIQVSHEDLSQVRHLCKHGYSVCVQDIKVDPTDSPDMQREVVLHELIENYLPCLNHDKVDELTDLILSGLRQLENLNKR